MYPILILRSELVCFIILIFLYFTARSYNINSESKAFSRILFFAIVHVIFDAITVWTVNHLETTPGWVNWLCHVLFYLSAMFYSNEVVNYVVAICYPLQTKKMYALGHLIIALYIISLTFLDIYYVPDLGTYSSAGPAAYVGYAIAFIFFIVALVIIFTHMKMMSTSIKSALIPMMIVLMLTEISQVLWRSVLFTGAAITIVTVGFFFSLENPVAVFKKKAMTDALTGVRSRSSFEEDIERHDKKFQNKPTTDYVYVFLDINDLRNVNNHLGHAEGDNYITLIATSINKCLKHSSAIYRIGGDEFLVMYYQVSDDIIEKELHDLKVACAKASEALKYNAAVAVGYARSSSSYRSLRDVVKTADYAMYQNKTLSKGGISNEGSSLGTNLNYSGLTDKIFDAMCASNNTSYPFITNMETNVTRIAPGWKEYFGLDNEFYSDFISSWKDRIHPDDFEGYMADIIDVINGHKKYHHYDYYARRANGEYVPVSCHGSMYRDSNTGTTYFTGFIVNHGLEENIDPITSLRNFDVLKSVVCQHMDEGKPFSILKLRLNNFSRINMLYGYNEGNSIKKKISEQLIANLGGEGEVFCQDSKNFSILFETADEQIIEDYYNKIFLEFSDGLDTEVGSIPILISGGTYINIGERCEVEQIRSGLVYATEESHYNHRNTLVFYHKLDASTADSDISILAKIHADALGEMKYFQLRYQPIIDIAKGQTVGAEALLRWIHPNYGEVAPGKFIAFIENDPCYYRLGLSILEHAIKDAKRFQEKIPDFKINVNITALQLQNESFGDNVIEILNKYDFDPKTLVLELTERCKEMDSKFLSGKIAELRERGILIAFDDFGTGYSTINLLMDIPVDEIKLDRDFVKDLKDRENYQLFVRALVLGKETPGNNYNICFEGVENEEMLNQVSNFGDFLTQGYHFARPLLIDDFNKYIEQDTNDNNRE